MDGEDYEARDWPMPAVLGIWGDQFLELKAEIDGMWRRADVAELATCMDDLAAWIPRSPVPNLLAFLWEYARAAYQFARYEPELGLAFEVDTHAIIADVADQAARETGNENYARLAEEARHKSTNLQRLLEKKRQTYLA